MVMVPDHRWKTLLKAIKQKKRPKDKILKIAYDTTRKTKKNVSMEEALELGTDNYSKGYLLSFLVCGATPEQIKEGLEIKEEVLNYFAFLFYDKHVFRNKLEFKRYILNEFTETNYTEDVLSTLKAGLIGGADYLIYMNNIGDSDYVPNNVTILQRMLQEAYFRGVSGNRSPLTSGLGKESMKWIGTTLKWIELMEKKKLDSSMDTDPIVALEKTRGTKKLSDLGLKKEDIISQVEDNKSA